MGMVAESAGERKAKMVDAISEYMTAKEIAERWHCARSSVDRALQRAGLRRFYFGTGRNGMVRYLRREVMDFELKRQT